jgi:hypothetical protein
MLAKSQGVGAPRGEALFKSWQRYVPTYIRLADANDIRSEGDP